MSRLLVLKAKFLLIAAALSLIAGCAGGLPHERKNMAVSLLLANEGECVTLSRFDWGPLNSLFEPWKKGRRCRSGGVISFFGEKLPKENFVAHWTGPSGKSYQAQVPLRELLFKEDFRGGVLAFEFGEKLVIRMGINGSRDINNSVVVFKGGETQP